VILPKDQIDPVAHLREIARSDKFHIDDPDGGILMSTAVMLETCLRAAELLDDSLFYAQMYQDKSLEGLSRREKMIKESQTIISLIRTGGLYP
jgi:hypothetical protein